MHVHMQTDVGRNSTVVFYDQVSSYRGYVMYKPRCIMTLNTETVVVLLQHPSVLIYYNT